MQKRGGDLKLIESIPDASTSDFISVYLDYMQETEPPYIYHRWCAITSIGALLGRNCYLRLGHFRVFPNLYTMLIGEPAARKTTAIKLARRLVAASGYETFADDKGAKEKFMANLAGVTEEDLASLGSRRKRAVEDITSESLFGTEGTDKTPREVFVVADEFSEFSGTGNAEFLTTLGNVWDWDDETVPFKWGFRTSKSLNIWQPTISILGGNTPEKFARTLPLEIIGDGFLSRMILIHGEKSDREYYKPPVPVEEDTKQIVEFLTSIRSCATGEFTIDPSADPFLEKIYKGSRVIEDVRFKSYNNRRYTQLLKLCIIHAAARFSNVVDAEIVLVANTVLTAAEMAMPRALGEFGKNRQSDTVNKVMDIINAARAPVSIKELWIQVSKDLSKTDELTNILSNLLLAEKIQKVSGKYLPRRIANGDKPFVNWDLLTEEERIGL